MLRILGDNKDKRLHKGFAGASGINYASFHVVKPIVGWSGLTREPDQSLYYKHITEHMCWSSLAPNPYPRSARCGAAYHLKPAQIDLESGDPYYTLEQLGALNRILALRDLGFGLDEIKRLLAQTLNPRDSAGQGPDTLRGQPLMGSHGPSSKGSR